MKTKRLVHGVGVNDADYVVCERVTIGYKEGKQKQKVVWECPFYLKWRDMLRRCYSLKLQEKYPRYSGCKVCDDWLYFSKFKTWMETQEWEGKQLDKDILSHGNKIYSPTTCVFISKRLNVFLTERNHYRGEYLIGVSKTARDKGKYRADCNDGAGQRFLGLFDTELEAHQAWLTCKLEIAYRLAEQEKDPRIASALIARYKDYTPAI